MFIVASVMAVVSQSVVIAIWLPGHILHSVEQRVCQLANILVGKTVGTDLRPNPNATVAGSRMSGLSLPSVVKNRSGLKVDGSG